MYCIFGFACKITNQEGDFYGVLQLLNPGFSDHWFHNPRDCYGLNYGQGKHARDLRGASVVVCLSGAHSARQYPSAILVVRGLEN